MFGNVIKYFGAYIGEHWLVVLFILSVLVDVSPIKINPWKWLLKNIGTLINKDLATRVEDLAVNVKELDVKVSASEHKGDERYAMDCRIRILRFGDEIRLGIRHSEEHFGQALQDITDYDHYCDTHPHFENNKTVSTAKLITDTYERCVRENDFA